MDCTPSNGVSNQLKFAGNLDGEMIRDRCYSLWTSGSNTTSSNGSTTGAVKGLTSGHNGNEPARIDSLLGPYSNAPLPDENNNNSLFPNMYSQVFVPKVGKRPIDQYPFHGFNWNSQAASLSRLMSFDRDHNNNIFVRPAWASAQQPSPMSVPEPIPYQSAQPSKIATNYSITKKNGQRLTKPKATYARAVTAKPPVIEDRPKRIHVSNIPFWMAENDLLLLFRDFGEIMEVQVITNEKGSKVSSRTFLSLAVPFSSHNPLSFPFLLQLNNGKLRNLLQPFKEFQFTSSLCSVLLVSFHHVEQYSPSILAASDLGEVFNSDGFLLRNFYSLSLSLSLVLRYFFPFPLFSSPLSFLIL